MKYLIQAWIEIFDWFT